MHKIEFPFFLCSFGLFVVFFTAFSDGWCCVSSDETNSSPAISRPARCILFVVGDTELSHVESLPQDSNSRLVQLQNISQACSLPPLVYPTITRWSSGCIPGDSLGAPPGDLGHMSDKTTKSNARYLCWPYLFWQSTEWASELSSQISEKIWAAQICVWVACASFPDKNAFH